MSDHLPLPPGRRLESRRNQNRPIPARGVARGRHASDLKSQLIDADVAAVGDEIEDEGEVDPRLVLKIKGATRLADGPLNGLHLIKLGEGQDWTYAVLSTRESRELFAALVDEYGLSEGNSAAGWNHPQTWAALLDNIDEISLYDADDRRDPELAGIDFSRPVPLDVLIWPAESTEAAAERIESVRRLVAAAAERNPILRIAAIDPRPQTTAIRVISDLDLLDVLLREPWVERVRPQIRADIGWHDLFQANMPTELPLVNGAPIGVVDGLIVTSNPLLGNAVLGVANFPQGYTFSGPDDHGTAVASVAVWGDLEFVVNGRTPQNPHPVVSARVLDLDENGRAVLAGQPHQTIDEAVRWMVSEYKVRVVNVSINRGTPADTLLMSELSATLDGLVRELKIVIVVSAGNRQSVPERGWLEGYPKYLNDHEAKVAEPGDAALVLTVGAITKRDVPGSRNSESLIAIAPARSASPFTRTGPTRGRGSKGTLKPEFVHYGGNWAHDQQTSQVRDRDPNLAVVTAVPPNGGRVVGANSGTSYAAPAVAHEVAKIATRYPQASGNMLRALTALSARQPENIDLFNVDPLIVSAYGQPEASRVLESGGANVILTIEDVIQANAVVVHRVPVPYEFAMGVSRRSFRVALAYDPPVRRSRKEYVAGYMTVELVRGIEFEELQQRYGAQPSVKQALKDPSIKRLSLPDGRRRPNLSPQVGRIESNTLVRRDFVAGGWDPDDEDYFLVVTHNQSPWSLRQRREYSNQSYAMAVQIADEERVDLDLYNLIRVQLRDRLRATRSH